MSAPTFGRYAEIPVDQMTKEQQEGYRFLVDGPRGRLPGPYKVWVHNPRLVHAAAPLGNHFTPGQSTLTEREREVLQRIIEGKPNKIIAAELDISMKTVEFHRAKVMEKTGVDSVAELVQIAMQQSE